MCGIGLLAATVGKAEQLTQFGPHPLAHRGEASQTPAGHPKLLHLWPVKLPQAGRSDYADSAAVAMREAASFRR